MINARKLSSAMSAAKAISDHMRDWFNGFNRDDDWVSMAVYSDGSYNTPKGLFYSFPVKIDQNGKWSIVQNLKLNEFSKELMLKTSEELSNERNEALLFLKGN